MFLRKICNKNSTSDIFKFQKGKIVCKIEDCFQKAY